MTENTPTLLTLGTTTDELDGATAERLRRIWNQAYAATTREDLRKLYADWAETYDEDHDAIGFFGHVRAAEMLDRHVPFAEVSPVLDAGAGTGAAGVELAKRGFRNLTAVDMSADMLRVAEAKGVYHTLVQADLGLPLDIFPNDHFQAAILVGVYSFGQAPAHSLDEVLRVVKPGGVIVFTVRTDFYDEDAMGVRSRIEDLETKGIWQLSEVSEPEKYLPKKDPDAEFRVWCYRVLPKPETAPPPDFTNAVHEALTSESRVKRIDHCHIWDSMGSRLYDRYIECDEYYLTNCEEEILRDNAHEIAGSNELFVELGCGSARKVKSVIAAALEEPRGGPVRYMPIDLSSGALESTGAEIRELFGGRVLIDARQGHFNDVLPQVPADRAKAIFFFGGSIGNIETLEDTVTFLENIRERMTVSDRFLVGMDLHKDEEILRRAYEAGPRNLSFFLNMLRRINNELGANIDLAAFRQESTYDEDEPYRGIRNQCVNLKLVTETAQRVFFEHSGLEVELKARDAIQVGCSRKFREEDIPKLMSLAGLTLRRQWFDKRHYFSLNECVRSDAR